MNGALTKEQKQFRIDCYAYALVNKTMGNKSAAYKFVLEQCGKDPSTYYDIYKASSQFYSRNKEQIEQKINQYQKKSKDLFDQQQIRYMIMSKLADMGNDAKSQSARIAAIKELNNMLGFNAQNLNIKTETNIQVEIV